MSDSELDDFGGFEAAEPEPDMGSDGFNEGLQGANDSASRPTTSTTDISAIPWLAASLQNTQSQQQGENQEPISQPSSTSSLSKYDSLRLQADAPISWPQVTPTPPSAASAELTPSDPNTNIATPLNITTSPVASASSSSVSTEASHELINNMKSKLIEVTEHKNKLQTESMDLKLRYDAACKQLEEMRSKLSTQQTEYDNMKKRHEQQLTELKESNSKAVSLLIEEYKESSKTAILQVQESCTKLFTQQLAEEADRFKQIIELQNDKFEKWKEEGAREVEKKTKSTLESIRADLTQEVDDKKQLLLNKFKEESEANVQQLENLKKELVTELENKTSTKLTELEKLSKNMVDDISTELQVVIKTQCQQSAENEREASLTFWESKSSEMLERYHRSLQELLESQKSSIDCYIDDKIKADESVRQSQLSALTVCMEAAQQQLKSLTTNLS